MIETGEILDRLHSCEARLEAQRGYITALEYGVRTIIMTLEQPEKLDTYWNHLLPEIADTHASSDGAMFSAALQQCLAMLGQQIADAADKKKQASRPR